MTHKTKKLSVAIIAFIAAICMFVAILGFVGMPEKANAALASTHTERIAEADAVDKTNVKSYTLYQATGGTQTLATKEKPAENATKVFFEYTPVFVGNVTGGSHRNFAYNESNASIPFNNYITSNQFVAAYAVQNSRTIISVDLNDKTLSLDRSNGEYRTGSTTEDLTAYYRFGYFVNSTLQQKIVYKNVMAYDNTGKDLGWYSPDDCFAAVDYVVTYEENDGDTEVDYAEGVLANATATKYEPLKSGAIFVGWYTDESLTKEFDYSTAINSDIKLYAKWISIQHIVKRSLTIGSMTESKGIYIEPRLTRASSATKVYIEYTTSNDNMVGTLTNSFAVVFNGKGNWDRIESVNDGQNSAIGWVNDKYWQTGNYTVIFDLVANRVTWYRDGVVVIDKTSTLSYAGATTVGINTNTTVVNETISNIKIYDNTGKDLGVTSRVMSATCGYTIEYPEVTFNADNGSAATKTTVSGATVAEPTAPTKDGCRFIGWYKDGQVLAYDFATEVTADITLTAKWAKIERVFSNVGTDFKSIYSKEAPAAEATKVYFVYNPETLAGVGGGHICVAAKNGTNETRSMEGPTLTSRLHDIAGCTWHTYVITFDLNTGFAEARCSYNMSRFSGTLDVENNNQFGVSLNGVTNVAFTWKVAAYDDTGKDLGIEYGQGNWNKHDYTATINCDTVAFGTGIKDKTVVYDMTTYTMGVEAGTKLAQPAALTKDGKYFAGWYTDSAFNNAYDFDSVVNADVTLYAKWVDFDAYYANVLTMGGASARLDESVAKSGIRFTVNVNTALLNELAGEGYNYTLGTLIVPLDYVTDGAPTMESLDASGLGYYNIVSTYESGESYYGTLANVKQENYGRKWVALGYVAIDMGDDTVKYIYAEYDESNAKSIYDVAESFYNEYKDDVNEVENVEIAAVYVDSVVVLDSGYQAVEKVTENVLPYTVSAAGNVITITVNDGVDFVIKSVVIDGKIAKVNVAADGKSATYEVVQQ